jgi:hypothetical protein
MSVRLAPVLLAGALVALVPRATGPEGWRASAMVGTLAAVEADDAGVAERVWVVDASGRSWRFRVGADEHGDRIDAEHLRAHVPPGARALVRFRRVGGELVAERVTGAR